MKLRTDRRESSDCSCVIDGTNDDFFYDTAMAHALVLAMADVKQQDNILTADDAIWYIEKRAEVLLREWGYTEPETKE